MRFSQAAQCVEDQDDYSGHCTSEQKSRFEWEIRCRNIAHSYLSCVRHPDVYESVKMAGSLKACTSGK